jgi:hypothetical protein
LPAKSQEIYLPLLPQRLQYPTAFLQACVVQKVCGKKNFRCRSGFLCIPAASIKREVEILELIARKEEIGKLSPHKLVAADFTRNCMNRVVVFMRVPQDKAKEFEIHRGGKQRENRISPLEKTTPRLSLPVSQMALCFWRDLRLEKEGFF